MVSRLLMVAVLCFATVGCNEAEKQEAKETGEKVAVAVEANIPAIVDAGVKLGLKEWAKKDKAGARAGASEISKAVKEVLIPYFEKGAVEVAVAAGQVLRNFGGKINPQAKQAIAVAAGVLQGLAQVPEAGEYMSKRQIDDVLAGLKALAKACDEYVAKNPAP